MLGGRAEEGAGVQPVAGRVGLHGQALRRLALLCHEFRRHADRLDLGRDVPPVHLEMGGAAGGLEDVVVDPLLAVAPALAAFHVGVPPSLLCKAQ